MREPSDGAGATSGNGHWHPTPDASHYPRPVQARTTVRGVLLLQLVANSAGGAIILMFLRFLLPLLGSSDSNNEQLNLLVLGVYLGVVVFIALPVNKHILHKA